MQAVGSYDASYSDSSAIETTRQKVSNEYFKTHTDVDFLVILSTFDYALPETDTQGFYLEVKNDTQGIGREQFNNSSSFGSSGRLQGTIDLGNITNRNLDEAITTLSHEISHRFGAYVKYKDTDGNINSSLLGKDNSHWSYLLNSKGSLLYGSNWQANPDGTFTATNIRNSYSPLDLYLMGIIPKEQVPPMLLIDNPSIDKTKLPKLGDTITGTAKTITINDIIAAEGERIPTVADSPKTFSIGYILLKRPGDNTSKIAETVELLRKGFAGRFTELTQSKGSISGISPEVALQIDTPIEGATITGPDVTVTGRVINTTGSTETGVTINGIPATVTGNHFIANHVPLQDGANTITVTATDANGLTTTTTRTVTAQAGNYLRIYPNIDSGTGSLEVSLRLDSSFTIANPTISIVGPATVTTIAGDNPDEYTAKFTADGAYTITARAEDADGQTYSDSITVTVVSRAQLDSLLKTKWEGMKAAVSVGNVEGALKYFVPGIQDRFRALFADPDIAINDRLNEVSRVELFTATERVVQAGAIRMESDGEYAYPVNFVKDENGIWKIMGF